MSYFPFFNHKSHRSPENRISDALPFMPQHADSLLDIGCAEGNILQLLRPRFARAVGVELDEGRASRAMEKFSDDPLVTIIHGAAETVAARERFDCVLLLGVLQHIRSLHLRRVALSAAMRATKGVLLVRTGVAENKTGRKNTPHEVAKSVLLRGPAVHSPLSMFSRLAKELGFRWLLIDNEHRPKNQRRGDLIVMQPLGNHAARDWPIRMI
jgi:cyclopropane fatty-acyl-phospholipid synthase-like methyltransferase